MAVLILRQRGPDPLPEQVVSDVEKHPHLQVLERSAKMLRIEGEGDALRMIADQHPGLQVSEERQYRQVDPAQMPTTKTDPKT
jgi:hypothetical protein